MSISPGTRLGQYEVQDFIGQGAMGVVYRAYHSQLERTGAVKVMQSIAPDPDTTARFRHEAQAIAQMRHPNIVNVYDFGDYEGTPYMIVEYVPGGSLAAKMTGEPLDHATAMKYLRGIAAGLDYAHAKGIVHRDVKPANVLLESDDTPVIADFGLAKLLQGSSLKSMTGVTTGTPAYMAPEQVTGSKVGPAADRYSLATIAYEMLTGFIPFDGEGLLELLYAQVHREPPPPSTRVPRLGADVDAVVMRGLAKDPSARWDTCGSFVEALAGALQGRPGRTAAARTVVMRAPAPVAATVRAAPVTVPAMPAGPLDPAELGADSEPVTLAYPSPPSSAPAGSRGGLWILSAVVLVIALLIAATAGYLITRPKPELTLSSGAVRAGDTLVVKATHVPANQQGQVELLSAVHSVPFQADANGSATVYLTVPVETQPGDHTVRICWNGTCHVSQTVLVLAPVVLQSPTPNATPSASPAATASPSPTHTASPTPTALGRLILLDPSRIPVKGSTNVYGTRFLPLRTVIITFTQNGVTTTLTRKVSTSGGNVSVTVTLPLTAVVGEATIEACDTGGCAYAVATVIL